MPTAIRTALLFSDIHLGWAVCLGHHARWLARLPEAADDAELVVLNGDIVDAHRGVATSAARELVAGLAELVTRWRREGRTVVCIEGNHDGEAAAEPLRADRWLHDFETAQGGRVRVLHGHRASAVAVMWDRYDRVGRRLLAFENRLYGRVPALRSLYRFGPGVLVSAIGATECLTARRQFPRRLAALATGTDTLVHGHTHYGPGRGRLGPVPTWRTGSFVSPGHLGTADRMLRYRRGQFERIGWAHGRWRAFDDGR